MASLSPIRACLFDMDGLLIDSEDKYTDFTNDILREYGKPDLPWNIKAQMQGRPAPEAGAIFDKWAKLPLTREEFLAKAGPLQAKYFPQSQPLPGTESLLATLASKSTTSSSSSDDKQVHIALATSSHSRTFKLKATHLESRLFKHFPPSQKILGDDSRIGPGRGKPCPDIYLLALRTINETLSSQLKSKGLDETQIKAQMITPKECLVFEDSVPGIEAGRRAGMQVIWVPHEGLLNEYRGREKEVLAGRAGALGLSATELAAELHDHDSSIGRADPETGVIVLGQESGTVDDGWGRMVMSLEEFPYKEYGIHV